MAESRTTRAGPWRQRLQPWLSGGSTLGPVAILRAGMGAFVGIVAAGVSGLWLGEGMGHWLIAPMGASAVLLFAVPASPLAQPWPVVASALLATTVALGCASLSLPPVLAAGLAVALTILAMFPLRCVHPPAGALALLLVLPDGPLADRGIGLLWYPVLPNVVVVLLAAVAYHRLTGYRYPHEPAPVPVDDGRDGLLARDLDSALAQYGEFLDVDRDDLMALFRLVAVIALHRQLDGLRCGDVMTANPVAVQFGDYLEEIWGLFRQHRFKAIPVTDRARRVIGIVTREDILRRAGLDDPSRAARHVRRFVGRVRDNHASKPEVVGQVMSAPVVTLDASMPLVEAVGIFAGHGHSHFPVVDDERRLVGIIARSDVLRALFGAINRLARLAG